MKKCLSLFAIIVSVTLCAGAGRAQSLPSGYALLPANPTSADIVRLSLPQYCGSVNFTADAYRVTMVQNHITVTMGAYTPAPVPLCPPTFRLEVDLGRLPAGEYTLNLAPSSGSVNPPATSLSNTVFTVTDARATKTVPYVRLDYSGHWWDPGEPGWGLFIWHDAQDHLLAGWFTYTPEGKPVWYVIQPGAWTNFATFEGPLLQTSRLGATNIAPNPAIAVATVGTATLDFRNLGTAAEGKFTYAFTGGTTQVRTIQRFRP